VGGAAAGVRTGQATRHEATGQFEVSVEKGHRITNARPCSEAVAANDVGAPQISASAAFPSGTTSVANFRSSVASLPLFAMASASR